MILPTLTPESSRRRTATRPRAVCPYCGVGCVLDAEVQDNRVTRITADRSVKPNMGMMCPKGALLSRVFDDPERLTEPMIRRSKNTPLQAVPWDEAIAYVADQLSEAKAKQGPESLAWYGSGQLDTEASYVFTKLFKGYLGCNNTDTNSRLCMSSAVAGYQQSFGSDGPPTCYDDIEHADTYFILGANMAENHPVLFNRIRRQRTLGHDVRVIVVDPRRTRTAQHGDLHVPVAPGGDVALLHWIARRLLDIGDVSTRFVAEHTSGGKAFFDYLCGLDTRSLEAASGVNHETLNAIVDSMRSPRRVLSFYCMGANQSAHGTDKNTALINLHLMLGQVGKPGCGPFSLTGQPNAMGGREVGYLSHQLPGYRSVEVPEDRADIEQAWDLMPGSINPQRGHSAVPMFQAGARGELSALWITCTNPVVSMPDASVTRAALERTPLVIVQDITARSETAGYADVLLPACQWGEKAGTMTNSERLVVRSHRFLDPPAGCRPDWWIPAAVGQALGFNGFTYPDSDAVWDEFRQLTRGRPCDLSGMTNDRLIEGPIRWPCRDESHPGDARRYTNGTFETDDGRARFCIGSTDGIDEPVDHEYPLTLTTGRVAAHWHTRTKSALAPELAQQEKEPFIEVHPDDIKRLGLIEGRRCAIIGQRGRAVARVRCTDAIRRGVVFATFHFGDAFASDSNINVLTNPAADPHSGQPELKACAVRLERMPDPQEVSA